MNDIREDQLLCPLCYIPVELTTKPTNSISLDARAEIDPQKYICGSCSDEYVIEELVRSSELSRRIEEGLENGR